MFVLAAEITIGQYIFDRVNYVQIVKSVDLLSDTAIIRLPVSALLGNESEGFQRSKLENTIKQGDPVTINLAYAGQFEKDEFKGFVRYIKPNTPTIEIQCEDSVYKIRKKRVNKNFRNTTLKEVLTFITEGTGVELTGDIPDVNFDKFLLKNINGAKALQKLKDEYGLFVFLDDEGKLYAGLRQLKNIGERVKINLFKNIVKHNLKYVSADDVEIYVKVIGIKKDNTKVEVFVGEQEGEQRTLHIYNISSKSQLKEIGKARLSELKYTGYRGTITTFLVPYATRGMTAAVVDKNYPDREGNYFISKVTTTFGTSGARRIIELDTKV